MSSKRYLEEFKIEAIKQVLEKGYSIAEVAMLLGPTTHSLYAWIKRYGPKRDPIVESSGIICGIDLIDVCKLYLKSIK
ncbi:hypothetical protein B9T11_00025 [Wohlfahrtiimonas chitiniclastica]|nr:hypothetical protein B9T11_00025 [Wohlfahrtiimonas chitiniclastica]OYQ85511.1 hypothetical protein B9T14_03205 [Wohlfahrtiimonas chitiniclastica]OYQ86254.1 hypothetical protein B9T15_01825 [Wohlfahrtiimonas chitiniclastica]